MVNKTKIWLFKRLTNWQTFRITDQEEINKIKNETDSTTNNTEVQRIIKDCY